MSQGFLGKAMSSSAGAVNVYTAPASTVEFATVTIKLANTGPEDAVAKVSISTSSAPQLMDQIEPNAVIPAMGGSLTLSCELMGPGESVFVECDKNTVAIRVTGLEEPKKT